LSRTYFPIPWGESPAWILAGGLLFALAGCSAGQAGPSATPTSTRVAPSPSPTAIPVTPTATVSPLEGTINLWLDWSPREIEALGGLIETFQSENPGVDFRLTYFRSDELLSRFEEAVPEGAGPSLLFGPDIWGPPLWEAGLIQDLTGLLAPGVRAGIHPLALEQVTYEGAMLGAPLELQGVVLYANRSLMPEPAETVSDLIPADGLLAQIQGTQGALDFGMLYSVSHLTTCGGEILLPGGEPGFAGRPGTCWLALMAQLARAGPVTFNSDSDRELFEARRAAWLFEGTWALDELALAVGPENLAIDPWPVYEVTRDHLAGYVRTENVYMAAGISPEDREASWEFLRYLISSEVQQILARPHGAAHLPTAVGIYLPDPRMSQAMAAILQGVPFPISPDALQAGQPLERAIFAVLRQGTAPDFAIRRALSEVRRDLAETP
jgi:ABC-type glycerol-3-phosphate transport system substrate-binding protein